MEIKMTEKEFRANFAARCPGTLVRPNDRVATAAVEAARAGGFEFGPEPLELPEQLEMDGTWVVIPGKPANLVAPAEAGLLGIAGQELSRTILTEAVHRYNAYPKLREKAEALAAAARQGQFMSEPLIALEAELAKAPK